MNLNMLSTSIRFRPISRDIEHTLIKGLVAETVFIFVAFTTDLALLYPYSTIIDDLPFQLSFLFCKIFLFNRTYFFHLTVSDLICL